MCVHSIICSIRLEPLKQNAFVSFVFFYLTTADVILLLFVDLSLLAAESQKKATDNKYSPLSNQKAVDHWNDNQKGSLFKPAIAEQKDLFPVQISLSLTSFNWCGLHPPKQKCEYQESVAETALSMGIGAEKEQHSPYSPLKQLSAARNYKMQTRKLKHRKMTELFTSMFSFPEDLSLIQQSSVFQLTWLRHEILKPLCTFLSFRKVLLLLRPAHFRFTGGRRHHRRWLCIHTMLEL